MADSSNDLFDAVRAILRARLGGGADDENFGEGSFIFAADYKPLGEDGGIVCVVSRCRDMIPRRSDLRFNRHETAASEIAEALISEYDKLGK